MHVWPQFYTFEQITQIYSLFDQVQSGDESEDRESQIYSSTSARDMSSVASTSIRDSWDPSMSSKDTWDPKMNSKDTWDPKISSRDTWDHSKNSRDSWELSTSARDSLEPRTSVYRNPLQVSLITMSCSVKVNSTIDILMTQPSGRIWCVRSLYQWGAWIRWDLTWRGGYILAINVKK